MSKTSHFPHQLYGAWRAAGLDAATRPFDKDADRTDGGFTFLCPKCTLDTRLDVDEGVVVCSSCDWGATGEPWEIAEAGQKVASALAPADWKAALEQSRFSLDRLPEKPVPVFKIGDHVIATAGNIVTIQAQAKSGKSTFLGAMIAATLDPGKPHLGIHASEAKGFVAHFDTEQSKYDHFMLVMRAMKRAQVHIVPDWLHSYSVKDFSLAQRVEAFFGHLDALAAQGRVKVIFLDGVADLVSDPNDTAEAQAIVDRLMQAAGRLNTVIIVVIHENPSGRETGKTRGHLGSQLERKAETNLRLTKDNEGVITVYSEVSRNCHIPKDKGPRFAWSNEAMMFVAVEAAEPAKQNDKIAFMKSLAEEIFRGAEPGGLSWGEVIDKITVIERLKPSGARPRMAALVKAGVLVRTNRGMYVNKL